MSYKISDWYRDREESNFFISGIDSWGREEPRRLKLINTNPSAPVRYMRIERQTNGDIKAEFETDHFKNSKLDGAVSAWKYHPNLPGNQVLKPNFKEGQRYNLRFEISTDFMTFIQKLEAINISCGLKLFSQDLIKECQTICEFCSCLDLGTPMLPDSYHHSLPVFPKYKKNERPLMKFLSEAHRRTSSTSKNLSEEDYKEFKYLLSHYADPNEYDLNGYSPLLLTSDMRVFELLLFYGANFTRRIFTEVYVSVFDLVRDQNNNPKLPVLKALLSPLQKSPVMSIQNLNIFIHNGRLITDIDCSRPDEQSRLITQKLRTEFTSTVDEEEERAVLAMSEREFEMKDDPQQIRLREAIQSEIRKGNQLIELIRDRGTGKIRGFNIFEWLRIPDRTRNHHESLQVLYCNLSCLDPSLQGSGLFQFLLYRPAYLSGFNQVDAIGMITVQIASFCLQKGAAFPKFQTDTVVQMAKDYVAALKLGPNVRFTHDSLACYVTDQIMVKPNPEEKTPSLQKRVFLREFLDQPQLDDSGEKGAVTFTFVTNQSGKGYKAQCKKLGVSVDDHLNEFGSALEAYRRGGVSFFPPPNPPLRFRPLPIEKFIFWFNRRIPSQEVAVPDPTSNLSML